MKMLMQSGHKIILKSQTIIL